MLKPANESVESLAWQARVMAEVRPDTVRVAPPQRSIGGTFIVAGWTASALCAGRHEARRWLDVIEVGRRFHEALAHVERPDFLDARADPWAVADRCAWGELSLEPYRGSAHVSRLESCLVPIRAPSQVIHGDLTGNVLFADPLSPAIIDVSAYWRPVEFATAIVVADALAWGGATVADIESVVTADSFGQFLARALIFRIVADLVADPGSADAGAGAYARAVDLAVGLTRNGR